MELKDPLGTAAAPPLLLRRRGRRGVAWRCQGVRAPSSAPRRRASLLGAQAGGSPPAAIRPTGSSDLGRRSACGDRGRLRGTGSAAPRGWAGSARQRRLHYEGMLAENGQVFDTTHEDNSVFSFEIGEGTIIEAWDITVRTMEVEQVACKPRKGSSLQSVSEEKARLQELKIQREIVAVAKEEEKRKREEAKAAAAVRVQAKLEAKKGKGEKAK
ncbi:peptidyl-prolyl cis-trans isomerase FKBP20-1 [Panicum miliaceum]|uniref:peptidylprolyl isomerase n=1 Tax=Panicum miliaceum TaxID=4540 RepID=A0A3L6SHN8_PANMI|nr:peptidyl-prolyl cis-trans isomerase FKBP20-1 [Panicum miliaceum]